MSIGRRLGVGLERTIYVIAGLPIALRGASTAPTPHAKIIRRAFSHRYWRPDSFTDGLALTAGLLLIPLAVPAAALWYTVRNAPTIRRRDGKGIISQFVEQLRLYASAGVLAPWYYIFSLHRDGGRRAATFLQRCETKRGIYGLLRAEVSTPLGNKQLFADKCGAVGVRCVACELVVDGGEVDAALLPDADLFVKPLKGSGGSGAERWEQVGPRRWSDGKQSLGDTELVDHLRSKDRPYIVQRRIQPHPELEPLTSGALPTVRALTILNEQGDPELVGASFRMSMGPNRTVDNIHAGGLACRVSLDDGALGPASDLGSDARLGWHGNHPTTGARIEGTRLPFWGEVKAVAVRAHSAFEGRIVIGWDIAIDEEGPIIIEGNRGPDMDLMQRFMETGFCGPHRFGELIAYHLQARGYGLPKGVSARDEPRPRAARGAAGTSAR
jgi:hypothetical protein